MTPASGTPLSQILSEIKADLGENAVLDLDRDVATTAVCTCGETIDLFTPVHKLRGKDLSCPKCGKQMGFDSIHSLYGTEEFLQKTPEQIGIPPLHIVAGRCGMEMRYYELSDDVKRVFERL